MRTAKQAVQFMKAANKRWSEANDRIEALEYMQQWRAHVPDHWIDSALARRQAAWERFDKILGEHVHDPVFREMAGEEGLLDGIPLEDFGIFE